MPKKTKSAKPRKGSAKPAQSQAEEASSAEEIVEEIATPEVAEVVVEEVVVAPAEVEVKVPEVAPPEPVAKPKVTEAAPSGSLLKLQDAARRFVPNFKDHWLPSIKKHASTQGFTEPATEDDCKRVLRSWGAKIK